MKPEPTVPARRTYRTAKVARTLAGVLYRHVKRTDLALHRRLVALDLRARHNARVARCNHNNGIGGAP